MPQVSYLITGGAGFIGKRLARDLLEQGARIRVLDSLIAQVHGPNAAEDGIFRDVELVRGDVRDPEAVKAALADVDGVFHLAAEVGVGQSMYEIDRYTSANDLGTAVLLRVLIDRPVKRIVVASSMSVYGEGLYRDVDGLEVEDARRGSDGFDPKDSQGRPLVPAPTPETKRPQHSSVYALNKYVQEQMTHIVGAAYGVETVALRLFNVYGPGQALSNPYTGVLANFASRLLNGRPPLVYEDGRQRRDFVHVDDVARAFRLAMQTPEAAGATLNIGSGRSWTVQEIAEALALAMELDIAPTITGRLRAGDIRHCFADITLAQRLLGYAPQRALEPALAELAEWVASQSPVDRSDLAAEELDNRGLVA